MNIHEAIKASQIHAARGYDADKPVVSVAHYGGKLVMNGWKGDWKKWVPIPEDVLQEMEALNFRPSGPRPSDDIADEIMDALTEIFADDDDFIPIGEAPDRD